MSSFSSLNAPGGKSGHPSSYLSVVGGLPSVLAVGLPESWGEATTEVHPEISSPFYTQGRWHLHSYSTRSGHTPILALVVVLRIFILEKTNNNQFNFPPGLLLRWFLKQVLHDERPSRRGRSPRETWGRTTTGSGRPAIGVGRPAPGAPRPPASWGAPRRYPRHHGHWANFFSECLSEVFLHVVPWLRWRSFGSDKWDNVLASHEGW